MKNTQQVEHNIEGYFLDLDLLEFLLEQLTNALVQRVFSEVVEVIEVIHLNRPSVLCVEFLKYLLQVGDFGMPEGRDFSRRLALHLDPISPES